MCVVLDQYKTPVCDYAAQSLKKSEETVGL